jgi:hypothetical protein
MFNIKTCGKAVHKLSATLRTKCVQMCGVLTIKLTSAASTRITTFSYTVFSHTTHTLTHIVLTTSQSVISYLYTLSTEPINTRTKGYIN